MLKDKLTELKVAAAAKIPPAVMQVMQQSRSTLKESDILSKTIKPGDRIPDFSLTDGQGVQVDMATLRAQGPLVISLYRGIW